MANVGYINKEVAKMYGIPYSELTPEQKKILHEDSVRRAKLIKEREEAVLKNNLKAFEDEAKMEKVLASIYASCQKEILASVTETIAKVQKAGGEWSYANQSALTRSRGLFEQIGEQIKALGQKEQITFRQGLSNIYTDQFLRQVYDLGQSITVKANFNRLNPALIQKTLDYPWSGAMFSDRLWQDKERLGRNLRVGLTQSMILGEGIPQITDRINKGIDTVRYNAERVARTETKRVTYCAHDDVYKDTGVEELRYRCANGGDSRTCQYCRADNGKVFKRGEEPNLHEEMHFLDMLITVKDNKDRLPSKMFSQSYKPLVEAFDKATPVIGDKAKKLFEDFAKECDIIYKKQQETFNTQHEDLKEQYRSGKIDWKKYNSLYKKLSKEVNEEADNERRALFGGGVSGLQDIYDAVSKGTFRDTGQVTYGHGSAYYTDRRRTNPNCSESLANYASLCVGHPELIDILAEDYPEIVTALRGCVEAMLKEVPK